LAGTIKANNVLVDNFNNSGNLQGLGTTIVDCNRENKAVSLFAQIPRDLPGCPGGVGLATAMTMLKSGWVIVGSTPSKDGTTNTRDDGCLSVLDSQGKVADAVSGPSINMSWGNVAPIDNSSTATIFVSNTGLGVGSPDGDPPVVRQTTVLRIDLAIPEGKAPSVAKETVIGSGFGSQADKSLFLVGPIGLALGPNGALFVSDAIGNRVVIIDDAATQTDSAGTGRVLTVDGLLDRPLAMATAPNGHLLVTNGHNGQVVEIDLVSEKQLGAHWVDPDKAQTSPGSGDLFGIAMTAHGDGVHYVEHENNTLVVAR
jgi:hypothetical protein